MSRMLYLLILVLSSLAVAKPDKLILCVTPWGTQQEVADKYKAFTDYLSEQLGRPVEFHVALDYDALTNDLGKGVVDVGIFSPGSFVEALDKYPKIQYLCTEIDNKTGKDCYESYIIVKKGSKIKSHQDLKDGLFAFVDEKSASGYKFPLYLMINKWGVDPATFFKKTVFVGNHNNVLSAVYEGQTDAGAVASDIFKKMPTANQDNDKIFDIIDKISDLPNGGLAASPQVDHKTVEKLVKILTSITPQTHTKDGRKITETLQRDGYTKRSAGFYDVLRQATKAAEEYNKKSNK